jgi:hypothetical protein
MNTMNKTSIAIASLALLAGCGTSSTPVYDTHFGEAVRESRQMMALNPTPAPVVLGIDGAAAHEGIVRYQDSFRTPPPVVNVINIGGELGSSSNGR